MHGKYRDANSSKEVDSILKEAGPRECLVWQNLTGERNLYYVKNVTYDNDEKVLEFELKDFGGDFSLKDYVYIKLEYRGTMLKTYINRIEKSTVYIKYPDEVNVKTVELRREKRTEFKLNEEILVTIRIRQTNNQSKDQILKFQLMDIAQTGLSVLVSNANKLYIENALEMKLTHIGAIRLKKPLELKMMYMQDYRHKVRGKSQFSNRAGFKLVDEFLMDELLGFLENSTRNVT